jgi:hypothetical protein
MMPGPPPVVTTSGNLNGPLGKQVGEAAGVLVVTGHVDGGKGFLEIFFMLRGRSLGVVFFGRGQILFCRIASLKAGRTEKDNRILDLLAAKAGERLLIFGEDAEDAPVGTVEERFVLVSQRRGIELINHVRDSRSEISGLKIQLHPGYWCS